MGRRWSKPSPPPGMLVGLRGCSLIFLPPLQPGGFLPLNLLQYNPGFRCTIVYMLCDPKQADIVAS